MPCNDYCMAKLSKWLITDGYTVADPRERNNKKIVDRVKATICQPNPNTPDEIQIKFTVELSVDFRENVLMEIKKQLIESCLKSFDGNQTKSAKVLGISVKTIYNHIIANAHNPDKPVC